MVLHDDQGPIECIEIGYGEDSATLHMLMNIEIFLEKVGDKSDSKRCVSFYRPSFGRNQHCFGEFDVIVRSEEAVYLIESKWTVRSIDNTITLEDHQIKRHEIMRWYIENWNGEQWDEFMYRHREEYERDFKKKFPGPRSLLSRHLGFILGAIKKDGASKLPVVDVVCFFMKKGGSEPKMANRDSSFRLEVFDYPHIEESDFIGLASSNCEIG